DPQSGCAWVRALWPDLSESDPEGEIGCPAAEIDLRSEEPGLDRDIPFRLLPAHFAADGPVADGRAHAAEHGGADRGAVGPEVPREDVVELVDEIADFGVLPLDRHQSRAGVRLDLRAARQEQEPAGEGDGHLLEFQVLLDLGAAGPRQILIDARHRALRVAEADAGFEVRADADQVLAADNEAFEVCYLEQQRLPVLQVVEEHIVFDAAVEPLHREISEREIHGLGARRRGWAHLPDL